MLLEQIFFFMGIEACLGEDKKGDKNSYMGITILSLLMEILLAKGN
jgi:hypothetical protein